MKYIRIKCKKKIPKIPGEEKWKYSIIRFLYYIWSGTILLDGTLW